MLFTAMACFAMAQAPVDANFDPSDVYFQAYLDVRAAEQLEKDGDFIAALRKNEQAAKLFDSVGKFYPDWKPEMVKNRLELSSKAVKELQVKAGEQFQRRQGVIAELEGGKQQGAEAIEEEEPEAKMADDKGILAVDPNQARQLEEALAEQKRLQALLAQTQAGSSAASRNATRVEDLQKNNQALAAKLKAAESNVQSLRAQMAQAPAHSEISALNQQIQRLDQEKQAMAMALRTSREDHTEALSKVELLSADMEIMKKQASAMRQAEANLKRDIESERQVANDVVKGQRKQMEALENALAEKSKQLSQAQAQISSLQKELEQSREAYNELREERDGLLMERDQMAALLKLNETGRIEQLIEQNMSMAKSLREANEKVERLNLDSNAAKDDVIDALRDLAIAKSQINRLQADKKEEEKRIESLTERLKHEEAELAKGMVKADPEEVEMLREMVRNQIRMQERRRQAKEVILDAAKQLGKQDSQLDEAIKIFDMSEIPLTPEEQKLVAEQQVDGEFVSPFARDRELVGNATAELNREMESYDRAAKKAYMAGRLLPTRELFELMVEQNPGHVPALCKLGVVQLKLDQAPQATESFRKAVELDDSNGYAHRMLGYAYLQDGDFSSAKTHVSKAIELAPDDAKAYLLHGMICYQQGDSKGAEENFKSAISVDPVPSEPYFNLALICVNKSRMNDARSFYSKALERGAVPDQSLESKLEKPQ